MDGTVDAMGRTIVVVKGFPVMATFYILPSRQILGQRFGDMLTALFPNSRFPLAECPDLADLLAGLVEGRGAAYVVYREDLDETVGVRDSLLRHFGAELSDEIIEIQFGSGLHQVVHQCWSTERLPKAA